jgi:hypothetical protein
VRALAEQSTWLSAAAATASGLARLGQANQFLVSRLVLFLDFQARVESVIFDDTIAYNRHFEGPGGAQFRAI